MERELHKEGVLGAGASGICRNSSVKGAGSWWRLLIIMVFGLWLCHGFRRSFHSGKNIVTPKNMMMVTFKFALMKRRLNNQLGGGHQLAI
jgi:hypothetical protein